ncbi:MAG: alpha/beta hydrolase [Actinobacteria bacterium]|nr:MAG: alpha/beta hydrolase [Actinomycetota bacterium]
MTQVTAPDPTGRQRGPDPDAGSQPNEVRALSALAFGELRAFPGAIRDMHLGIAQRAFRGVGPAARPVQIIHDALSRRGYDAIGSGAALLGRAADAAMETGGIGRDALLSSTRPGSAAIAALNGLIGDRLERTGSDLHQPTSVRLHGQPVAIDPDSLGAAFPEATSRLVVFLHGLMGSEFYWQWNASDARDTYGARLAEELGFTPVYLRYNSGRHVSENGRSVAELLEQLVEAWPVPVSEVALVGHSIGGLVARSACYQAAESGQRWTEHVCHVVSLGTPHLGAPLEQGAHLAAAALSALPETRMFGTFLRRRSAGIRDLRHGSLVDEDWRGRDPDALRAAACREVPLLEGATHCFVSATVTRSPRHPVGRLLGDVLVLVPSATGQGRTRRIPFQAEYGHHVGPAHHLALLNHPEVYDRLRGWLAKPPAPMHERAA